MVDVWECALLFYAYLVELSGVNTTPSPCFLVSFSSPSRGGGFSENCSFIEDAEEDRTYANV